MPTFSLDHGPRRFTPALRSEIDAPLPRLYLRTGRDIRDFGSQLEPRYIVRAGSLDQ
jgi:hypothetical protein